MVKSGVLFGLSSGMTAHSCSESKSTHDDRLYKNIEKRVDYLDDKTDWSSEKVN